MRDEDEEDGEPYCMSFVWYLFFGLDTAHIRAIMGLAPVDCCWVEEQHERRPRLYWLPRATTHAVLCIVESVVLGPSPTISTLSQGSGRLVGGSWQPRSVPGIVPRH